MMDWKFQVENILFQLNEFPCQETKGKDEKLKDQAQPLRTKFISLPMVVNAMIRGDTPLYFKCGAPQGNIPSAELRIKWISKKKKKIKGLWYLCFWKQNAESNFGIAS